MAKLELVDGQIVINQPEAEIITPDTERRSGIGSLLGGVAGAGKSIARLLGRKGQQRSDDQPNFFKDLFLNRAGGGGKDYMMPDEASTRANLNEFFVIGGDDMRKAEELEAEKILPSLYNQAMRVIDAIQDIDDEETKQKMIDDVNSSFDKTEGTGLSRAANSYYGIIQKYGYLLNKDRMGRAGGRVEYAEGTKMASAPDPMDERNNALENLADSYFGKPLKDLTPKQIEFLEEALDEMSKKPIAPRMMAQTGGITESRVLPPEFIEAAQRTFLTDLATQSGMPSVTTATAKQPGETDAQFAQRQAQAQQFGITRAGMAELAPQVAAQDPLQAAAYQQAVDPTKGLGSFQPFLTKAGTAADATTALTGTGAGTGVGSIASYTSPYQQQVIDTTMAEFDRQAAIRANQQAAATLGVPGAFGGGREGVQRAEYQAASDRNRAATFANLQQQGFQNAAARRQQDLANQMSISQLQSGLGARAQDFSRAQISGLGTLGAAQQAQTQAVLDAQRQAAQMAIEEPRQALARFGQGIAAITPGAGSVQIGEAPAAAGASPLMKALGLGLAGADIYGRIF
jgi:hypothetical protein